MFVGGRGVLVSLLAMFVSRFGVLLRVFVLAEVMVMGGLMMMMRGSVVMSGGLMSAAAPGYPPYNIKRSGENAYNISVAVAGFAGGDLSIEVKENVLTIRGNKQSSGEEESDLIYQGIAERNFERKFQLADHVQIKGASLENGLLQVDLLRVVPEAMKPRAIPITTAKKAVLEGEAAKIAA